LTSRRRRRRRRRRRVYKLIFELFYSMLLLPIKRDEIRGERARGLNNENGQVAIIL